MESVKYYHLFTGELAEGQGGLGRISLVLSADFDRVTAEREALQLMLNDLEEQITSLEQRRHAEQQACQAAGRRVEELAAENQQLRKLLGQALAAVNPTKRLAKNIRAALNPTAEAVSHDE